MEFESEVILHLTIVTRYYNQTTTQKQLHLTLWSWNTVENFFQNV